MKIFPSSLINDKMLPSTNPSYLTTFLGTVILYEVPLALTCVTSTISLFTIIA